MNECSYCGKEIDEEDQKEYINSCMFLEDYIYGEDQKQAEGLEKDLLMFKICPDCYEEEAD